MQVSDYTIWIMLTISLSANKLRITFTRSVEAETVDSVAQGRRTPFARRSLSFFQPKSRPAPWSERSARANLSGLLRNINRL